MSKRFGRNQKRKLKEALSKAELLQVSTTEQLNIVRHKTQQDARSVQIMHNLFSQYFIALQPPTNNVDDATLYYGQYDLPEYRVFNDAILRYPLESISDATIRILNLDIVEMDSFKDFINGRVHVQLKTKSGRAAYAATPKAIACMDKYDFARHIVEPMCAELIGHYKKRAI